jgi:CBS domain-containing protein
MMRTQPPTVSQDTVIDSLVHDHIMQTDEYAFPVLEGDKVVGLVTLEDIRSVSRDAWQDTTVGDIMTPVRELETITPDEEAVDALNALQQRDIRQLPVMRNGTLAGLIRRRDIIKWLQLHSETEPRQI